MKFLYTLISLLILTLSIVAYHYFTANKDKKYQDISRLAAKLKYITISTQFKSTDFKEFAYE